MMEQQKKKLYTVLTTVLKAVIALVFLSPFYVALIYSVKSKQEIAFNRLAFPTVFHWDNFSRGIEMSNFFSAVKNSALSTVVTVVVLTIICSMAAYIIARKNNKFYNTVYYIFIAAMIIPFQSIMTPLYINLKSFALIDNLFGFILAKIGFQIAFTILIITGFVKSIPLELEEAAAIDGASRYGTFWKVVFPLMKPIIFTSVVLNSLSVWNDFQVSVVILQKVNVRTISLTQFYFFGENSIELGLAFAVFVLSMIPIIILYLLLQKYIISGITAGAIKG
jgi:raffinose/stachyose/melibiose transport system permease protein